MESPCSLWHDIVASGGQVTIPRIALKFNILGCGTKTACRFPQQYALQPDPQSNSMESLKRCNHVASDSDRIDLCILCSICLSYNYAVITSGNTSSNMVLEAPGNIRQPNFGSRLSHLCGEFIDVIIRNHLSHRLRNPKEGGISKPVHLLLTHGHR